MSRRLRAVVNALTIGWTAVYTSGLPPEVCNRRMAEITSDLWEGEHGDPALSPAETLARLLRGIPADLRWRVELGQSAAMRRRLLSIAAATAMLSITWWWITRPIPMPLAPVFVREPDPDLQPLPPPPPPPPSAPVVPDRPFQ